MKHYGSMFVAFVVACVLVSPCCFSTKARTEVLLPQLQRAWGEVQEDVTLGVSDAAAADALPDPTRVRANIDLLQSGLKDGDESRIAVVDMDEINHFGERGIEARIDGRIPSGKKMARENAELLFERLHKFVEKVGQFVNRPIRVPGG